MQGTWRGHVWWGNWIWGMDNNQESWTGEEDALERWKAINILQWVSEWTGLLTHILCVITFIVVLVHYGNSCNSTILQSKVNNTKFMANKTTKTLSPAWWHKPKWLISFPTAFNLLWSRQGSMSSSMVALFSSLHVSTNKQPAELCYIGKWCTMAILVIYVQLGHTMEASRAYRIRSDCHLERMMIVSVRTWEPFLSFLEHHRRLQILYAHQYSRKNTIFLCKLNRSYKKWTTCKSSSGSHLHTW